MVCAVHDPRSIGVHTYVERLSLALAETGMEYRPSLRADPEALCHFHLANSTRAVIPQIVRHRERFLMTVHDVIPRARVLRPVHRALIVPLCMQRAARVVVHSRHAAALLLRTSGLSASQIEIVPHPAPIPPTAGQAAARAALAHTAGAALAELDCPAPPLFVVPGALKGSKLVVETLRAAEPLLSTGRARLLLAGHVSHEAIAREAVAAGALLLRDPDRVAYQHAIVAADVVVCVRSDSVGESNGPLLDAVGAGRASLVTAVGSAPEIIGESARVVTGDVAGIRAGMRALLDGQERRARASAARIKASELTWAESARAHRELLEEVARA